MDRKITPMIEHQLTVSFISSELENPEPDLVVSFAMSSESDPMTFTNLILLRTPRYEKLRPIEERGVSVSYDGSESEELGYLRQFRLEGKEAHVITDSHHYSLDLHQVEQEDFALMRTVITKMNTDKNFGFIGA